MGWKKNGFDYIYEAAKDFAKETGVCVGTQTITTVATQAAYALNPDFLEVLTRDKDNEGLIKFATSATAVSDWLSRESYSDFLQNDNADGYPESFAIATGSIPTRMTGTATAIGTHAGGESTLTNSSGAFLTLYPGDSVINTTASLSGVVIALPTIATAVKTAMFDLSSRGGAYASWASSDAYVIQPQPRYSLYLDPPPDTSGYIITVTYVAKPMPVYSDYGTYSFATGYEESLIKYAAWLYKYRDSKQNQGDPLYVMYEKQMRKAKNVHKRAAGGSGFNISFMK